MELACLSEPSMDGVVCSHLESPKIGASAGSSLVHGSTWSAIWQMSWPLTVNMLGLAAMNLWEGWIAGRLGADAQAAMGVGGQLWFLFMMMTLAVSAGTTAVISRFCGAGDLETAAKAGRQALLSAALLSAAATALGLLTSRSWLHALGASGGVEQQGVLYLNMCLLSILPYTVLWIMNSIFRASGDSFTPMVTMVLGFAATIICEYFLCLSPFNLGVQGIGLSWMLCSTFGIIVNSLRLRQSNLRAVCSLSAYLQDGLSIEWTKRFLVIGIPACMQDLALIGGSLGVFLVLSKSADPLTAQAAWAAGWRLEETLTLMPMYGLNLAAAAIVGQNLGAKMPHRARICGWQVTGLGAVINLVVAAVMYIFAPTISASLCANAAVASSCTDYIRIVCWTEPFFACWTILSGAMQGAGYTKLPMFATMFSFGVLRVLLSALLMYLSRGSSTWVWVSMAVSTVIAGILLIVHWHRGHWQSQQI